MPQSKVKIIDIARPAASNGSGIVAKRPPAPQASQLKREPEPRKDTVARKGEATSYKEDVIEKKIEAFEKKEIERFTEEEQGKIKRRQKRKNVLGRYVLTTILLIILGAGVYSAIQFLPKVKIKIITRKNQWNYTESVAAAKNVPAVNNFQLLVAAEIFSQKKNFSFSFPASGRKQVEQKAAGKIIIYNNYSSQPQILAAATRFAAPDGKIFRLNERTVVPGATVVGGKIAPSKIEAMVMADQAGTQYNLGPISRFSIPGFQGTPKYQGFFAESKTPMQGGFIGETSFPASDDIVKAKEKAQAQLKEEINAFLMVQIPKNFKILDGSSQFQVLKEEINQKTDEAGNFSVYIEAESSIIAFRESDLITAIVNLAKKNLGADFEMKDYKLDYGAPRADFKQGQLSFAINFQGTFQRPIEVETLKEKIIGKNESELRNLILNLPDVEKATIAFWPFWVKTVPEDLNRITIEVE